jgi:hypothetical protein
MLASIAVMNAITGVAIAALLSSAALGADARAYRECAAAMAAMRFDCSFMYPPAAAVAMQPLTWMSAELAAVVMTAAGLGVLVAGVTLETRGRALVDKSLVFIAVLGFAPVVYELMLGQVTLLVAATMYPVVRSQDQWKSGLLFGVALAMAPKPMLALVLIWMLVWRRQALGASIAVALAVTGIGLVVAGPEQYRSWLTLLTGFGTASVAGTSAFSLHGNLSLWPLDPFRVVLGIVFGVGALWAILRDPSRGFVAALLGGLVLAPYTGLYALSVLLLAVPAALAFAPRATPVLVLVANPLVAMLGAFAPWAGAGIFAALPLPGREAPVATIPGGVRVDGPVTAPSEAR